jgi:ABC-type nitrate/sulfonate/bicarbonate transport system substrate-binding protein
LALARIACFGGAFSGSRDGFRRQLEWVRNQTTCLQLTPALAGNRRDHMRYTSFFALCLAFAVQTSSSFAESTKMMIATGVDPSFSAYYVAKSAGIFEKNGLDVQVNTGPSGSAMVAYVIQNQVQSAFGAEAAGIQNHNIDPNVVVAAEGVLMLKWYGLVARDYTSLDQLKGKKIGVARGSGSEVFWLALIDKLKLNPGDFKIVQVEAPEMVAALERHDIDAFTAWEPWLTRAVDSIQNTKLVQSNEGIMSPRVYIYLNRGWAEKNPAAAVAFMRSMVEATDLINKYPTKASAMVASFLKLDKELTEGLMKKLRFDVRLDDDSLANFVTIQEQLKGLGKLAKPIDFKQFIDSDYLKQVRPDSVNFTAAK